MTGRPPRGTMYADLHVHSKHARACSPSGDLENLAKWARRKGIGVLATGDFTHPAWRAELKEKLVPAGGGLWKLEAGTGRQVQREAPRACSGDGMDPKFMLGVEISTIYRKGERTRKVHHLVYVPDFETMDRFVGKLERVGNLRADGRPILGLDSRDLLEMTLDSGPGSYLVPAHIWTPWFSALGSKGGFDAIEECYGDLAGEIFAIETGLSADPEMNWRVSALDRYRLVSNSDAHSPERLGREACVFEAGLDYYGIKKALETGQGYVGTIEVPASSGKYFYDGDRACKVRMEPKETKRHGGRCPECGRPMTIGVLHRVEDLADRDKGQKPATGGEVTSLVPLRDVLGELNGTSAGSKRVAMAYDRVLNEVGPELEVLARTPEEEVQRGGEALLGEAVARMRRSELIEDPGYDGVYGTVRMFKAGELDARRYGKDMFGGTGAVGTEKGRAPAKVARPVERAGEEKEWDEGLDQHQLAIVKDEEARLVVKAGPGAGKTRVLTERIRERVRAGSVKPEECLVLSFTERAVREVTERLEGIGVEGVRVRTFHGLGHELLKGLGAEAGWQRGTRIAGAQQTREIVQGLTGKSERVATRVQAELSRDRRAGRRHELERRYRDEMDRRGWMDLDDLLVRALEAMRSEGSAQVWARQWREIYVDEYQDTEWVQVQMLKVIAKDAALMVIGDPDQSIYGFRGASPQRMQEAGNELGKMSCRELIANYRSTTEIASTAMAMLKGTGQEAGDGKRVSVHAARTAKAEAEYIVKRVEGLLGGHSFYSIDTGRGNAEEVMELGFADIAVLYRTRAQGDVIAEALERSGMPYEIRSDRMLDSVPEVTGLVARARGRETGSLVGALEQVAAPDEQGWLEIVREVARGCTHWDELEERLVRERESDGWDPRSERIALLSLHASKGLEFEVVFITGCEEGLIPLRFGKEKPSEEERRLLYVGMTRARRRLVMTWARKRMARGRVETRRRSGYLDGLELEMVGDEDRRARKSQEEKDRGQLELI